VAVYSEREQQERIKRQLQSRCNGFVPFAPAENETVPAAFCKQVRLRVGKTAVVDAQDSLTYAELDCAARNLSRVLRREGVVSGTPVAILMARPINFIPSMLGVMQAGGFYIPLDPSFPEDRNAVILRSSEARIVLTERGRRPLVERLVRAEHRVLYVDEIESGDESLAVDVQPDDLACIIFTSGSTGRPKGVMQTHRNVLQIVRRYTNALYLDPHDRMTLLSSCSVIASVGALFGALLNGATLFPFSVRDGGLNLLADWLDRERITLYDSAPSLFRHLMKSVPQDRRFQTVRTVRVISDRAYRNDWELFKQHFPVDAVFVNNYGCSEMSTVAAFYMNSASALPDSILPVGYSLNDVDIAIVDANGAEVSVAAVDGPEVSPDIVGEIVLKSRYLSPGYWNNPDATDGAFSGVAGNGGVRLYRTGDIGIVRSGTGLMHLGREDRQVKISGFRVEISEVEACLHGCPGVREAAVVTHVFENSEHKLIGFVGMEPGNVRSGADIRSYVQGKLPDYMVPSEVMVVDEIPCTPNGKVDRGALTLLKEQSWSARHRRTAQTPTEQVVSKLWMKLLNLAEVGVDDNFFELNGDSLLGMRLFVLIETTFRVQVELRTLLQYPTVRQLAAVIEELLPANRQ